MNTYRLSRQFLTNSSKMHLHREHIENTVLNSQIWAPNKSRICPWLCCASWVQCQILCARRIDPCQNLADSQCIWWTTLPDIRTDSRRVRNVAEIRFILTGRKKIHHIENQGCINFHSYIFDKLPNNWLYTWISNIGQSQSVLALFCGWSSSCQVMSPGLSSCVEHPRRRCPWCNKPH